MQYPPLGSLSNQLWGQANVRLHCGCRSLKCNAGGELLPYATLQRWHHSFPREQRKQGAKSLACFPGRTVSSLGRNGKRYSSTPLAFQTSLEEEESSSAEVLNPGQPHFFPPLRADQEGRIHAFILVRETGLQGGLSRFLPGTSSPGRSYFPQKKLNKHL